MEKINIAIFVSGGGTNCENLIRYFNGHERVNCALVISNRADAFALEAPVGELAYLEAKARAEGVE